MRTPGYIQSAITIAIVALCAPLSAAQGFGIAGSTDIRERVAGAVLLAEGVAPIEVGDQVGLFAGGELIGSFAWASGDDTAEFSVLAFGDIPQTAIIEGATDNQVVKVQFYDSSTDTFREDVRLENAQGEGVTYRYAGEDVPPLPIDLPGLDLTPTRALNLHIGVQSNNNSGGGDGGSGGGVSGPSKDVDADGKVTTRDAALVLRIVTGRGTGVSADTISRADVNGDGTVSTSDAIEIMRNR
jgi:hypothetical protein